MACPFNIKEEIVAIATTTELRQPPTCSSRRIAPASLTINSKLIIAGDDVIAIKYATGTVIKIVGAELCKYSFFKVDYNFILRSLQNGGSNELFALFIFFK